MEEELGQKWMPSWDTFGANGTTKYWEVPRRAAVGNVLLGSRKRCGYGPKFQWVRYVVKSSRERSS